VPDRAAPGPFHRHVVASDLGSPAVAVAGQPHGHGLFASPEEAEVNRDLEVRASKIFKEQRGEILWLWARYPESATQWAQRGAV
jgi:hypothetical protein